VSIDKIFALPRVVAMGNLFYLEVEVGDCAVDALVALALPEEESSSRISRFDVDCFGLVSQSGCSSIGIQRLSEAGSTLR
jgi:hypothetical protein